MYQCFNSIGWATRKAHGLYNLVMTTGTTSTTFPTASISGQPPNAIIDVLVNHCIFFQVFHVTCLINGTGSVDHVVAAIMYLSESICIRRQMPRTHKGQLQIHSLETHL